ncbi:hypothetical protein T10_12773 [Trichinella papuae]|uniref:Uncharacterized protein n=1 Tax=Trichinella papuae TaxID=268474 RepID=A0A0V1N6V3_9BILA|nr:hypothetical protein T10_12773 [Trichinella papuae]
MRAGQSLDSGTSGHRPTLYGGRRRQRARHQSGTVATERTKPSGGNHRLRQSLALASREELLRYAEGDAGPRLGYPALPAVPVR